MTTVLSGKWFLTKSWASGDAGGVGFKPREAPLAKITNGEELQAWARKLPRPFWAVIAARMILRGLPTGAIGANAKDSLREMALPVFRAAAVSWTACRYPAHETELAAAAEAAAGFAFAAGPKVYPAYAAAAVVSKSCGATDVAYFADTTTALYPTAAAAVWPEISNDATRAEEGVAASAIAGTPLWRFGRGEELLTLWQDLKQVLLAANQDWQVWTLWYEDRLAGRVRKESHDLAYVRISDELWDQGPAAVNAEIKRRIEASPRPAGRRLDLVDDSTQAAEAVSLSKAGCAQTEIAEARARVFRGFFSYSHFDAEVDPSIAEAFYSSVEKRVNANLVNATFQIWRDKEKLKVGDYWDQAIQAAIGSSDVFIVLLTPKWISSDYCRKEFEAFEKIEAMRNTGGYVIPIYGRDIEEKHLETGQRELLDRMKRIQYERVIPQRFARLSADERIDLLEGVADSICAMIDRLRG